MPPIRQLNDQLSPERGGFEAVSEGTKAFGFGAAPSASQITLAREAIRNAQGMIAQVPSMLDYCTPQAVSFIGLLQRAADGADNAAQLVNAGSSAAQQSAGLRGSIDAGVADPYNPSIGCKQQEQWSDGSWHDCLNPGWLHKVQQCVGAAAQAVASAQPAAQPKTQPRSVIGRMPRSVSPIVTGRPSVVAMNHPARFGLGAFGDHAGDPAFMAAWGAIEKQMQSEGAGSSDIDEAKNLFSSTVEQLYAQPGVDAGKAIEGAQQLVMYGKTVAGAVSQVSQLAQLANNSNSADAAKMAVNLTGTMIGLAVAAAPATAGVGAAIIAGLTILVGVLQNAGWFGDQTPQQEVCSNKSYTFSCGNPSWVVGCVCVWDQNGPVVPGSPAWRRFPDQSSPWFDPKQATFQWQGAQWGAPSGSKARPIDWAFPPYHKIQCDVANAKAGAPTGVGDFLNAFFTAWKLNREYALNGLKVQDDWQVFVRVVRAWNKARLPGSGYDFTADSSGSFLDPSINCANNSGGYYVQSLVQQIINNNQTDILNGNAVHIHTGTALLNITGHPILAGGKSATSTGTSSTAATVAKGTVAAAAAGAAGIGIYAWVTHQAYGIAAGKAYDATLGKVVTKAKRGIRRAFTRR